ncbi:MAG: hypothetical protein WCF65_01255 [Parachlamydiaceae bacterium]
MIDDEVEIDDQGEIAKARAEGILITTSVFEDGEWTEIYSVKSTTGSTRVVKVYLMEYDGQ